MLPVLKDRSGLPQINLEDLPSRAEVLSKVCSRVPQFHRHVKPIDPVMVDKALANDPFEDHARILYAFMKAESGDQTSEGFKKAYRHMADAFLRQMYNSLTFIPGLSFDVADLPSLVEERRLIDDTVKRYESSGMKSQVKAIEAAYKGFCALRTVFASVNRPENGYGFQTVVPVRYLPELLVAAPVWFVEPRVVPKKKSSGSSSSIVRHFCDLGRTRNFAHLFQMYNRTPRWFTEFEGRDVMPLPIVELVGQVRGLFDYLVIATPYHDLASKEWREAKWVRNIDPFLFGFLKDVPEYMFFLGRWSGTGLFPLVGDMIADTMNHIRENKALLKNFHRWIAWHRGGSRGTPETLLIPDIANPDHPLVKFADDLLGNFDQGKLFSWLREEDKSPQTV